MSGITTGLSAGRLPDGAAAAPWRWGTLTEIGEAISPSFDVGMAGPNAGGNQLRYDAELWEEMARALNARGRTRDVSSSFLGVPLAARKRPFRNPLGGSSRPGGTSLDMVNAAAAEDDEGAAIWAAVLEERARDPGFLPHLKDGMEAETGRRRRQDVAVGQAAIPDSAAGMVGSLIGQMGAVFLDPVQAATMPIGVGASTARTLLGRLLQTAGREAALQAGVAAALTPLVALDAAGAGMDYGIGDALTDIAVSAAAGGVFGAAAEGVSAAVARKPGLQAAAERMAAVEDEVAAASPFERTPQGDAEHQARLTAVAEAVAYGEPLPDLPPAATELARAALAFDTVDAELAAVAETELAALRAEMGLEAPQALMAAEPPAPPPAPPPFAPEPHLSAAKAYVKGKGSLKPAAVGKALGLAPADAERVLKTLAGRGGSGLFVSKKRGDIRRVPRMTGPEDVIAFLARRGGLRDNEGHDLRNVSGLGSSFVPRAGPLIRKDGGMGLDEAGEILAKAGYFGFIDPNRPADISEADVLDLLERASLARSKGKRLFTPEDQLDGDEARMLDSLREADAAQKADAADTMRAAFTEAGLDDLDDDALADAFLMWERLFPDSDNPADVVEAFVMRDAFTAHAAARSDLGPADGPDDFDVPWFDDMGDDYGDGFGEEPFGDGPGAGPDFGDGEPDAGAAGERDPFPEAGGGRAGLEGPDSGAGLAPTTPEEAAQRVAASLADLRALDGPDAPAAMNQTQQLLHDLLPDRAGAVDPALADRNRQLGQLGADSPLRPGDRAEQADVDGTPLFDAARSPDMLARLDADVARIEADEAAIAAAKDCLL